MEILEERNYVVYKHTSPSNKSYIGITSNYKLRCNQHKSKNSRCRLFSRAIQKHGWDNFTHEILEDNLTLIGIYVNAANLKEI